VSVAGGDGQDQAGIQLVLNHIDFGLDPAASVTAPRFGTHHHLGSFRQTPPELGSLVLYEAAGPELASELTARGHRVTTAKKNLWTPTVIAIDPATGLLQAAGDPQANRHAAALP
jgi:gamma-glutamyltranspeptidase